MSNIVVFGISDFASLAHFYLRHDSPHKVVAFSVTEAFLPADRTFEGLPIVPFEAIESSHKPDDFEMFAPMSPRGMNKKREAIYLAIKSKGYRMISYVSSKATVFPEAVIGDNCFILEDNTLQPFTPIGSDVIMWSGNHIGHHGQVMDHVMFTSHVVLSGHCVVEPYSYFGVNSTIKDNLRIGEGTLVAMDASVQSNTEPWSIYRGNPAEKQKVSSLRVMR